MMIKPRERDVPQDTVAKVYPWYFGVKHFAVTPNQTSHKPNRLLRIPSFVNGLLHAWAQEMIYFGDTDKSAQCHS